MKSLKLMFPDERVDCHSHTLFSDGELSPKQSVEFRLRYCDQVAITDHYGYIESPKLYVETIRKLQVDYPVIVGVEVEYAELLREHKRLDHMLDDMDIVLIEYCEYTNNYSRLKEMLSRLRVRYKGMLGIAHMDFQAFVSFHGFARFREFIGFLSKQDIFIEINMNHMNLMPVGADPESFFKEGEDGYLNALVENGALVALGSDSHIYEDGIMEQLAYVDDVLKSVYK